MRAATDKTQVQKISAKTQAHDQRQEGERKHKGDRNNANSRQECYHYFQHLNLKPEKNGPKLSRLKLSSLSSL